MIRDVDAHQLIFLKINLHDLLNPEHHSKIIMPIKDPVSNMVDMVPVAFLSKSDLDAVFALPTSKYEYNDGNGA